MNKWVWKFYCWKAWKNANKAKIHSFLALNISNKWKIAKFLWSKVYF